MDPFTDADGLVHTGTEKHHSSQKFTDKDTGTEAILLSFHIGTVKYGQGTEKELSIH